MLVKEKGIKLNPYYFEAVENTKDTQIRKSLHQANIFFITEDFIKFCSLLKELFEFKIADNESFRFSLKQIIDDCKKFKFEYDNIMDEELNLMERKRRTDEGIIYNTKTIKAKVFEKELKKALYEVKLNALEHKEKQNLLTVKESGDLALLRDENKALQLYDEKNVESLLKKVKKKGKPITIYNCKEVDFDPLEKIRQQDLEIEKAPTIIGNQKLVSEPSIYDEGIYLSKNGLEEWEKGEEIKKTKSAKEEADDFFNKIGF